MKNISIREAIDLIAIEDLVAWYLDDGSWHKSRHTMHLYSNSLNLEETEHLIKHIERMFGIAPCLRKDRKKDGRCYFYIYFPRKLVLIFAPIVEKFLLENNLHSLLYKVGYIEPSEISA